MTNPLGAAGNLRLSVANPDLHKAEAGKPVIYLNQTSTLVVTLVNDSRFDLALSADAPSALEIYLPDYFTAADVQGVSVDVTEMPDWKVGAVDETGGIPLIYAGAPSQWPDGGVLTFKLKNVRSSTQTSKTDSLQINPTGIPGTTAQVTTTLSIIAAPVAGNAKLADVLSLSLDHQGIVYVSQPADPLASTLFLNIKNVGGQPLFAGTNAWPGKPQVQVTFTYGGTTGALAPIVGLTTQLGNAWGIEAAVSDSGGNSWTASKSSRTSSATSPSWTLAPAPTNKGVIGTGDQANVTFSLSRIVTFLKPGHTQMTLRFSGFARDDSTAYDEEIFVVDVLKERAPDTRGLLSLYSKSPVIAVTSPTEQIQIPLTWSMKQVAKVRLINALTTTPTIEEKDYGSPPPALGYDSTSIPMTGFARTTPVYFTLQAFDGADNYLDSMQFTAVVRADEFVDPVDGKNYPVVRIGNQQWMAANLDRAAGSYPSPGDEQVFGRLYPAAATAVKADVDGWRLPQRSDWDKLVATLGSPTQAYDALAAGGSNSTGFNAVLSGFRDNVGNYSLLDHAAYYWTGTPGDQGQQYANLSCATQTVNLGFAFSPDFALAVRYVRDVS